MSTLLEKLSEKKPKNDYGKMGVLAWMQKKWRERADMTEEDIMSEIGLDEEYEGSHYGRQEVEIEPYHESEQVKKDSYTDKMVIDDLKDDLFNIYILLEMENILMSRFLYEDFEMLEKLKKVSDDFHAMADDIYKKWEKMFGTDLEGRR